MAGYNYEAGMSTNAVTAYRTGKVPASKIDKSFLQDLPITVSFAKFLIKKEYIKTDEWHHSGGSWFNSVNFYEFSHFEEFLEDVESFERAKKEFEEEKIQSKIKKRGKKVEYKFPIWGGSRKRPRVIGHKSGIGLLVDGWIRLESGSKKKASSVYIDYKYI